VLCLFAVVIVYTLLVVYAVLVYAVLRCKLSMLLFLSGVFDVCYYLRLNGC